MANAGARQTTPGVNQSAFAGEAGTGPEGAVAAQTMIPGEGGVFTDAPGIYSYGDGGQAPVADLVQTSNVIANQQTGLTNDDVRALTKLMAGGLTWAQAVAAWWPIGSTPQAQMPTLATLNNWQAVITARSALNPPFYEQ